MRLSQMTLGADVNIEIGQGTCTMKYSPKVNEQLAKKICDMHPLQDADTAQGILQVYYETDQYMRQISGLDKFTFQPGGGSQAIFLMASMVRAYFGAGAREETSDRLYSHPSDAAAPVVTGYKIVILSRIPKAVA